MYSDQDLHKGGVAPFGHPRINDRSHLPAAFRSVPRPSSPLGAKASTGRPYHAPARTPAVLNQSIPNQPTLLVEQNQTPPPPTPTKAAAQCRRRQGGERTDRRTNGRRGERTDGDERPSFTQ